MTKVETRPKLSGLSECTIVSCDFLHLDTARREPEEQQPDQLGEFGFAVRGKPRPAVILYVIETFQRKWFMLAKLTTKGIDKWGRLKKGYHEIGDILHNNEISYLEEPLQAFPVNLVRYSIRKLNPLEMKSIFDRLTIEKWRKT